MTQNAIIMYMPPLRSGNDYIVDIQNTSSRTFTVTFQPKQLNATEHVILIADDDIFEDKEHFRLRIHALRFIGEAANHFRAQPGVNSSFTVIAIKDNDCEFIIPSFTINFVHLLSHTMFPAVILVNWTVSDPITVIEGEGVTVELFGEAFGLYATPIAIGVICAETVSINVQSGKRMNPVKHFNMILGTICAHTTLGLVCSHPWKRL